MRRTVEIHGVGSFDVGGARVRLGGRGPRKTNSCGGMEMAGKAKSGGVGEGTREHPWHLKTPSGTSEFLAFRDETLDPPALVVTSGSTELQYHLRCNRRPALDAQVARRLDASRERGRAEAGGRRDD